MSDLYSSIYLFNFFYLVTCLVPIANQKIKFSFGAKKWYIDNLTIIDSNWAEASPTLKEVDRREVEEGANLIFGLKHVSPVSTGLDWAVCARHPVLPRV